MKTHHRSPSRRVAIVGAGMSKFGAFKGMSSRDLFVDAYKELSASIDRGIDPSDIELLLVGNFSSELFEGQGHVAPIMADSVGLVPIPAIRIEDACASSGVALRQGMIAIASGMYDIVLVAGVEKMTALPTTEVTDALASAGDILFEIPAGFTFPGFYSAMATSYMHRYGATPEHLMHVAMKNHNNGARNPKAQFGITIEDWMEKRKESAKKRDRPVPEWNTVWDFFYDDKANPMIAWPLRLFDCSPITDGAAAVLLVAEDIASRYTDTPISIIGSGQASDYPLHDRDDLTSIRSAKQASENAYLMAGVSASDIQLAEVHDCFTIAEIIASEDIGIFEAGSGFTMAQDGITALGGQIPINTSGGLKSKGHPVGASGVGQAVEIWKQMRGEAGSRQVKMDISLALSHNVGATGQTCVVHIYERRN